MNFGDLVFQLTSLIMLLGLVFVAYFTIRSFAKKKADYSRNIEQKQDRLIELLEKNINKD